MMSETQRTYQKRKKGQKVLLFCIPIFYFGVFVFCYKDVQRISFLHLLLLIAAIVSLMLWYLLFRVRKHLGHRIVSIYLKPETEHRITWLALRDDISVDEWIATTVGNQAEVQYKRKFPEITEQVGENTAVVKK